MTQRDAAIAALRAAISSGEILTLSQLAARSGVSIRTAHDARQTLLKSGEISASALPRLGRRRKTLASIGLPPEVKVPGEDVLPFKFQVWEGLSASKYVTLSTEQQRAILSHLILHSPDHNTKVAAQNALTRLDAQAGTSLSAGPGVPLTEEARIARLSKLMSACGWITVKKAAKAAFDRDLETDAHVPRTEETSR